MKNLLYIVLLSLACCLTTGSCGKTDEAGKAAQAAKTIYDSLFAGNVGMFIDSHFDTDSIPDQFKLERVENARLFLEQQDAEHRGVNSVRISRAEYDDSLSTAMVFLIFCYGDSTNEEVVVPMIRKNDTWLLR